MKVYSQDPAVPDAITFGRRSPIAFMHDDMNGQTFLRVFNGVCRSPQTPRKVKKYLGCAELQAEEA
jgi:hypothetical protein